MSWVVAARLDWIPLRGARILRVGERSIALFRTVDDSVYALQDRCPHKGGPLSQGIVHGRCVTCPLHDWVIDLATGLAEAPDEGGTATYPVRVEDGRVYVSLPAAAAAGAANESEVEPSEVEPSAVAAAR